MKLHQPMIVILLLFVSVSNSHSKITYLTYSEWAMTLSRELDSIATYHSLDAEETGYAIRTVGSWYHIGPCKNPARDVDNSTIQSVITPSNSRYYRAITDMIGEISKENLGREPTEFVCKFAEEISRN